MIGTSHPTRAGMAAILVGAALSCGCGLVPKARLDESRKLNQSLQADNAKLRDVALRHRTQAEDLAQRAVDDQHRLADLEEENTRLSQSVMAYQGERDRLDASYQKLSVQVRGLANPGQSSRATARAEPGPSGP